MFEFFLSDLTIGTPIDLSFTFHDSEFSFSTIVKRLTAEKIYLDAIKVKGTVLPLEKCDIKVDLTYFRNNNKPIWWENCKVKTIKDNQGNFYFVFPNNLNGKILNRRTAYRIKIDLDSEIFFKETFYKTIIHDLSYTGFSFISKEELPLKENDVIGIRFNDNDLNCGMKLVGKIVRIKEVENGTLYGCSLVQEFENLELYISTKQREYLVKHSKSFNH